MSTQSATAPQQPVHTLARYVKYAAIPVRKDINVAAAVNMPGISHVTANPKQLVMAPMQLGISNVKAHPLSSLNNFFNLLNFNFLNILCYLHHPPPLEQFSNIYITLLLLTKDIIIRFTIRHIV